MRCCLRLRNYLSRREKESSRRRRRRWPPKIFSLLKPGKKRHSVVLCPAVAGLTDSWIKLLIEFRLR
jgi:hypothetical protein